MGRTLKEGLDYFGHETDASQDPKILAIESLYGVSGYAWYFKLLEQIYRTADGSLELKTDLQWQVWASYLSADIDKFRKYIQVAAEIGLFDAQLLGNDHILTSNGVKKRIGVVAESRERARKWNEEHRGESEIEQKPGNRPAGAFVDVIERDKKKVDAKDPDRFTKGKFGHMVRR